MADEDAAKNRLWRRQSNGRWECIHELHGDPMDLWLLLKSAMRGETTEYIFWHRNPSQDSL